MTGYDHTNTLKRGRPISMVEDSVPKAKRAHFNNGERQLSYEFNATLHVNKDYCTYVNFNLTNTNIKKLPKSVQKMISEGDVTLRVVDFCPKSCLLLYRDYDADGTQHTNDAYDFPLNKTLPHMTVEPRDDNDKTILAFMKGLLTRNSEMAVVALPSTDYQILLFFGEDEATEVQQESSYDIDELVNMTPFSTTFQAILVNRYNLILDLDYTLIRTRVPKSDAEKPVSRNIKDGNYEIQEFEFFVDNARYICMVRPGTDLLLGWAMRLFKLYVVTNATYEYAKEVVKLLDPKREHLLVKFPLDEEIDDTRLKEIVKSRLDLVSVPHIPPPLGQKDLQKYGLNVFSCVIFDDDKAVWKNSQHICILPFEEIIANKHPKTLFKALRNSIWHRLSVLARKKDKMRSKMEKHPKQKPPGGLELSQQVTYSQQHVLDQISFD